VRSTEVSPALLFTLLFKPTAVFNELSTRRPLAYAVFFRLALWLGLVPPVFAYIGASNFGWRRGAVEPIYFSSGILLAISIAYFLSLLFGFVSSDSETMTFASAFGSATTTLRT